MVITKVDADDYDIDDYMECLEDISYQNECLTNETKNLLKTII